MALVGHHKYLEMPPKMERNNIQNLESKSTDFSRAVVKLK